jgi:2-dehydro-3-deoxyglucarate aldolase/4-hydroxy-2-oxoheptanedioate aldolase
MRANHTKEKLLRGATVFGCALQQLRSTEVPRALAAAGFDYVFIDAEHTGFDLETIQDLVAASVQAGITPIVRVAELLYSLVARALDVGAQGIILPRMEDPRLLAEALQWMRYPPLGCRGFGVLAPLLDYEQRSFPEITEHLNANTLAVVQFETRKAIECREELLDVPGIDVAMVGPADLSISLGFPGQLDHPDLVEAVLRLQEACQPRGIVTGIQCRNTAQARVWVERGLRFVGAGSEHTLLLERARESVASLRSAQPPR